MKNVISLLSILGVLISAVPMMPNAVNVNASTEYFIMDTAQPMIM